MRRTSGLADQAVRRRRVRRLAVALLVIGALGVSDGIAACLAGPASGGPTAAPSCPAGWTCATMPSAVGGGTVQINPVKNVQVLSGTDPWAYINLSGFPAGRLVNIYWCADTSTSNLTVGPLCALQGGPPFLRTPSVGLRVFADGTSSTSFELGYDPSQGGQAAIMGTVPGTTTTGNFFCGSGKDACGVVISVPQGSSEPNPSDSIVIPVTFNANSSGCTTANSTHLTTQSEVGLAMLLPAVNRAACAQQKSPVTAINTEQNGVSSVQALSQGQVQMAFTDDPEDPAQQKYLSAGKYDVIPVALTANVVAFLGEETDQNSVVYPQSSLKLSANMVAGIMTSLYKGQYSSDIYQCSKCSIPPCFGTEPVTCSLFVVANYVSGFKSAFQYGAYPRADQAGITDAMMHWICSAPAGVIPLSGKPVIEPQTAAQTFLAGLAAGGNPSPTNTCPVTDQVPPLTNSGGAYWVPSTSPSDQLKWLSAVLPNLGSNVQGQDVFAPMNWAWAQYLGLNTAALQNASNAFVGPTPASIDAAVADATSNPDGTITPKYVDTGSANSAASYVLPAVIYAVVPQGASTSDLQSSQSLLNNILDVTGGKDVSSLPSGFVPLTSGLYQQAQNQVAALYKAPPPTNGNKSGGGGGPAPGNGSGGSGNAAATGSGSAAFGSSGTSGSTTGSGLNSTAGTYSGSGGTQASSTGGSGQGSANAKQTAGKSSRRHGRKKTAGAPSSSPLYSPFLLAASGSRYLVPLVIVLGFAAALLGAVLLFWDGFRKTVRAVSRAPLSKDPAAKGAAGDKATPRPKSDSS